MDDIELEKILASLMCNKNMNAGSDSGSDERRGPLD